MARLQHGTHVNIRQANTPQDIALARALFEKYSAWLGMDLSFQGFAEELAALPGLYAPPQGRLLLALEGDIAAGCVALRLPDTVFMELRL